MDKTPVYVLVTLGFGSQGDVTRRNMGVTFNIHEAEAHQNKDVSNEYETHGVDADWKQDAEVSALTDAMREFRGMVADMQAESLR